jgi:hypothetical protein
LDQQLLKDLDVETDLLVQIVHLQIQVVQQHILQQVVEEEEAPMVVLVNLVVLVVVDLIMLLVEMQLKHRKELLLDMEVLEEEVLHRELLVAAAEREIKDKMLLFILVVEVLVEYIWKSFLLPVFLVVDQERPLDIMLRAGMDIRIRHQADNQMDQLVLDLQQEIIVETVHSKINLLELVLV